MSKFYAVKRGRTPGIYTSWPACQSQINGFSGALHKSFANRSDALHYLYDGQVPEHELNRANLPLAAQLNVPALEKLQLQTPERLDLSVIKRLIDPSSIEETEPFYYGKLRMPIVPKSSDYEKYDRSILDTSDCSIVIYIDGSKRPSIKHRGSGAYCRYNRKDFFLSCPFTEEIGHRYQINTDHFEQLSSPTMEYLAFAEVLWRFLQFRFPLIVDPLTGSKRVRILNPRLRITFIADYDGVKNFTEGHWTPHEDYIIKIRAATISVIQFLRERGIDVVVFHTRGHQGMLGNELSDLRAKSTVAFDTMIELVAAISEKVAREN